MRMTEQRKTLIANILECLLHCILLVVVAIVAFMVKGGPLTVVLVTAACIVAGIVVKFFVIRRIHQNVHWYISILDTIPFMMHATDMDMNWIFMNKATADFLKLDRDKMMGQHCSNWKAAICGTDRCSAQCLRNGNPTTYFEQNGLDLRVDTNWLHDKGNNRIGYVEVVQDISSMVQIQREQEHIVSNIRGMYDSLVSASLEIDTDSQALAQGSLEQASAIDQLSYSIVEVKSENEQNLDKTEVAAQLAGTIQLDAEKSGEQMQRMTTAVGEITSASRAINNVMKVIDDIAFQTNILALNASVEAARAGAHGKGFAVVAGEVRNLAIKSAEAAKNTSELIQNSISKAELGAQISDDTAVFLQKIITDIQESTRVINEIAESSRRQNEAISQINEGIKSVSQVIQMNSTTAQRSAEISKQMSLQTTALQGILHGKSDGGGSVPASKGTRAASAPTEQTGFAMIS